MYVGRSGPRGLLTGPRSLRIDFTRAILFDYFRKGARGGAPACLSALAFRGHGGGPSTGGLCPHKWLPGSAVAHLPLIPTPGLTFASSFLCSCFPLPLDTPWPPLFLSSSTPPSPNLSLSLSLSSSYSLLISLSFFSILILLYSSPFFCFFLFLQCTTLSRQRRHTCAPRAPSTRARLFIFRYFRTAARYTTLYASHEFRTRCRFPLPFAQATIIFRRYVIMGFVCEGMWIWRTNPTAFLRPSSGQSRSL